jgi:hypothetical protein
LQPAWYETASVHSPGQLVTKFTFSVEERGCTTAGIFLPFVGKFCYSSIFFLFSGFTVVYFLVATFLLPETKGKTLEEIEAHFEGKTIA